MKHMQKLAGLLLALAMVFVMSVPVTAAGAGALTGGSITINNAVPGQTYNIYQIFYLESYSASADEDGNRAGAYVYKVNPAWNGFFAKAVEGQSNGGPGLAYVHIDEQGYAAWNTGADAAAFAKAALAYAQELVGEGEDKRPRLGPDASETASGDTVEFTDLKLGYYLMDTTLGTLCSLDTTAPDVEMYEKNTPPSIDKKVQEDSAVGTDQEWGESNTAQIGDTVNFRTIISVQPGAQNYVLHDEMSAGLTLDAGTITVNAGDRELTENTDYAVKTSGLTDDCDFEITFAQTWLDTIDANTEIIVAYSAVLNQDASINDGAGESVNTNKTRLDYGDGSTTDWDETRTRSFSFEIVKTKGADETNKYELLDGAEFELYDAGSSGSADEGKKIPLIKEGDHYRVAAGEEASAEGFQSAVIAAKDGRAVVTGLDADTAYWLEEIKQPAGYNRLDGRVEVKITDCSITASVTTQEDGSLVWQEGNGGVHIINQAGARLPSTGGRGTAVFYVAGSILLTGAAALLIVKKRRDSDK